MSKEIIQPIELPQNCKECVAQVEAMGAEMKCPFIVLVNTINELNADATLLDSENPVDQTVLIGLKDAAFANRLSPGMQNNKVQEATKAAADCPGAVIVGAGQRKAALSIGL